MPPVLGATSLISGGAMPPILVPGGATPPGAIRLVPGGATPPGAICLVPGGATPPIPAEQIWHWGRKQKQDMASAMLEKGRRAGIPSMGCSPNALAWPKGGGKGNALK